MTAPLPVFTFYRGSTRLVVLGVRLDELVVTDYQTQETPYAHYSTDEVEPDPGGWLPPADGGDVTGHLALPGEQGLTTLWVRYDANPEVPVEPVAHIRRT